MLFHVVSIHYHFDPWAIAMLMFSYSHRKRVKPLCRVSWPPQSRLYSHISRAKTFHQPCRYTVRRFMSLWELGSWEPQNWMIPSIIGVIDWFGLIWDCLGYPLLKNPHGCQSIHQAQLCTVSLRLQTTHLAHLVLKQVDVIQDTRRHKNARLWMINWLLGCLVTWKHQNRVVASNWFVMID